MFKSNLFQKSLSLIMAFVLLVGIAAPAVHAAVEESAPKYYYAMGDAMTLGVGLDLVEDENGEEDLPAYYVEIAKALAEDGIIDDAGSYHVEAKKRYRIEELRYLIDADYAGDGYTKSIGGLKTLRDKGEVKNYVANAEVISIAAGTNNFSTYIVEQMMYYLENGGAVKYAYSFDEFAGQEVWNSMETISDIVMDKLTAAAPDLGDQALELIEFIAEVSTYAVMSYITSFNELITTIYELNPDAQIYVIGMYNPVAGEKMTFEVAGKTLNMPIGDFFGALVELGNAYSQILAPRAYDYTYVDPGNPELLIDQMGNPELDRSERIPTGLMTELLNEAGDAAVKEIVQMFADNGVEKTEQEALAFLQDLIDCKTPAERDQVIMDELNAVVSAEVYKAFVKEMKDYLGQFGNAEDVVSEAEIKQLLTDLENAADEAAREQVAADFVDGLISDPDLQNQAAAQVIYEYIEEYGLSDYVTVDNVVELLEDMAAADEADREAVATEWVHDLAVTKITTYVQSIVGDSYTTAMAETMLNDMDGAADPTAVAKEALWNDVFADFLSEKIEAKFTEKGLTLVNYPTFDAFVAAIYAAGDDYEDVVRDTILASGAAKVSDAAYGVFTTQEIIDLFSAMDSKATDAEKKAYLNSELGFLASMLSDSFWSAYTAYVDAANTTIVYIGQYLDGVDTAAGALAEYVTIQEEIIDQILLVYKDNFDSDSGSLDLSGFADFNELRKTAIDKILNGYEDYTKAIEQAKSSADTFDEKLDPVYELLESIAEVDTINLNHLLKIVDVLQNPAKYEGTAFEGYTNIGDIKNNIMTGQDLPAELKTVGYLAIRYYLADAMMIMPSANGHATIAAQVIKAINGENTNSTAGNLANKVINGGLDIYHLTKEFLSKPTTGSGQIDTLINPENYVAIGDNISYGDETYVKLLADALAMEYNDTADFDQDVINNLSINGMRTVELLALLSDSFNGDAYTEARFGSDFLNKRAEFQTAIKNAELITLNIGINDLVTYPMNQALLAYNGEETYEMNWRRFFSDRRVTQLEKGKDAVMDLLLGIIDNADSRLVKETGKSAYDEAETALRTVSTAVEALAYSLLNYGVNLDASVEAIAQLNTEATIVLVGFYNPMEDTYVNIDREVSAGGVSVDLSKYTINTSALTEKVLNQANRFLTNYVGFYADELVAANKNSRFVTVGILDTELNITDTDASKDLSTLVDWKTVSVLGKEITIKVPEYLYESVVTGGEALHPNANGHLYIRDQILAALDFEIHADVQPEDNWKYYGDVDPELTYVMDDESSLYELVMNLTRQPGEDVGFYDITADVVTNGGYYEVDTLVGKFEIKARPITITVKQDATITVGDALPTFTTVVTDTLTGNEITGVDVTITGIPADSNTAGEYTISATLNDTNYVLAEEVVPATLTIEEEAISGAIEYKGSTLSLEGEVFINAYFTVTGFDGYDVEANSGLLIWNSKPADGTAVFGNQDILKENLKNSSRGYGQQTDGFAAAEYADEIYMVGYVKVGDTYYYSEVAEFSVQDYCETIISRHTTSALKSTCIAMLHYGAAAQEYFSYNTSDLANANIVAEYPAEAWNADLINDLAAVNTNIPVSASVTHKGKTLSLNAATAINYYYTFSGEAQYAELLIWDGVTGELTADNASYTVEMTKVSGRYGAQSEIFPAALYSKTIFACAHFVDAEGNHHYSEVIAFNPEAYAAININNNARVAEVCKRMVIYGEYARILFNK